MITGFINKTMIISESIVSLNQKEEGQLQNQAKNQLLYNC